MISFQKIMLLLFIPFMGCTQSTNTLTVHSASTEVNANDINTIKNIIEQRFGIRGLSTDVSCSVSNKTININFSETPSPIVEQLIGNSGQCSIVEIFKRAELQKSFDRAVKSIPITIKEEVMTIQSLLNLQLAEQANIPHTSIIFGFILKEYQSNIDTYFQQERVIRYFPKKVQLVWSKQSYTVDKLEYIPFYFIQKRTDLPIQKEQLKTVELVEDFQSSTGKRLEINLTESGSDNLEKLSKRNYYKELGFMLDSQIISIQQIRRVLNQGIFNISDDQNIDNLENYNAILNTPPYPIEIMIQ